MSVGRRESSGVIHGEEVNPGEILTEEGELTLNAGRETRLLDVASTGDRPIQVGSHFHFFEVNRALHFNRLASYGFRLDIPAGTSVRFEPGEERTVRLVALGGRRIVRGLNGLVSGALDDPVTQAEALERARARGYVE
jgi:urease beta subunit